jgi:hypothetical protein
MRDAFTGVAILVVLGSGARANPRSHREPELHLTVRVYDSGHVGADDLHQAVERADIIFRQCKDQGYLDTSSPCQRGSCKP